MSNRINLLRYRLEVYEPYTYWNHTAKPVPVHTHRWRGAALCDDINALKKFVRAGIKYRIVDAHNGYVTVEEGKK